MHLLCTVRAASQVWDSATNLSKSVSNTAQGYSKGALERVSTMTGKPKETVRQTVEKKTE